jgi:hypothetical protein
MPRKKKIEEIELDIQKTFRKVPNVTKVATVKDMIDNKKFKHKEVAEILGVQPKYIYKLYDTQYDDEQFTVIKGELTKVSRATDVIVNALQKNLEEKALIKLTKDLDNANFRDTLRTVEVISNINGTQKTQNQTNIQIVIPDVVRQKFGITIPNAPDEKKEPEPSQTDN